MDGGTILVILLLLLGIVNLLFGFRIFRLSLSWSGAGAITSIR